MTDVFPFLRQLAENNNKPWFDANRTWYETARSQVVDKVEACLKEIGKFEDIGPLKAKETLFRINRDVRFSKNKDPYKLNFSAMIARGGKKQMDVFGYYVHFQPGQCFMAAGVYEPNPAQLARIRQEIDYNAADFRAIVENPAFVEVFGKMEGNQLKSAPKGYPKDHPDIEYLRYTQFYFSSSYGEEQVLRDDFPEFLAQRCRQIRPFLEFLHRAQE